MQVQNHIRFKKVIKWLFISGFLWEESHLKSINQLVATESYNENYQSQDCEKKYQKGRNFLLVMFSCNYTSTLWFPNFNLKQRGGKSAMGAQGTYIPSYP